MIKVGVVENKRPTLGGAGLSRYLAYSAEVINWRGAGWRVVTTEDDVKLIRVGVAGEQLGWTVDMTDDDSWITYGEVSYYVTHGQSLDSASLLLEPARIIPL